MPLIIEAMAITVHTPRTIPVTVSIDCNLRARNAENDTRRFSEISARISFIALTRNGGKSQDLEEGSALLNYSDRKASIGSSRAAFHAGKMPEHIQITPETVSAMNTAVMER